MASNDQGETRAQEQVSGVSTVTMDNACVSCAQGFKSRDDCSIQVSIIYLHKNGSKFFNSFYEKDALKQGFT